MLHTIVLATDGSAAAERATDFAASLAARYGARVRVLHAFPPVPSVLGEPNYSRALDQALAGAQSLVDGVAKRLHELGVTEVDADVIEGQATNVILDVVETRNPDLLILGARGLGAWKGIVLGSVSMAVTQRAPCPVLVVK